MPNLSERELAQFQFIADLAKAEAGLSIPVEKASMVFSRLSKRVRELEMPDLDTYCRYLRENKNGTETSELITRLTTNVTSFYRENHHFEFLKDMVLNELLSDAKKGKKLRIWSAGCSSGPEPYCLAMTILQMMPNAAEFDIKILATDIDKEILEKAKKGVYSSSQLSNVPEPHKQRHFRKDGPNGTFSVRNEVRELISFNILNLLHSWPMKIPFNVIFCRNVLIYFDQATQDQIIHRFCNHLTADGYLMLGHSERVGPAVGNCFDPLGNTIYRRSQRSNSEGATKWH